MIRTHTRRAAVIVGAAALALAACGDDDSDSGAEDTEAPAESEAPAETEAPADTEAAEDTEAPAGTDAPEDGGDAESSSGDAVTVELYAGEFAAPYDPQTLVVMDYAALDTIDALGLGDRVVGIPSGTPPPPYLEQYADTENVGNLFEPDFEAINALEPDLIIAGGRSQPVVPDLAEIAPTIDVTGAWGSDFVPSMYMNTEAIGEIFGLQDEVATAIADFDAAVAEVHAAAADAGTGLVVLTSGGEVSAYGPDPEGRFDVVYSVFGIQPAADQVAIDTHGDAVSFEYIAETNPDMLIVLDRDAAIGEPGASAQEILDNDLVNGTSAAQNGKILYVDTPSWYLSLGGVQSYDTMITEVATLVE